MKRSSSTISTILSKFSFQIFVRQSSALFLLCWAFAVLHWLHLTHEDVGLYGAERSRSASPSTITTQISGANIHNISALLKIIAFYSLRNASTNFHYRFGHLHPPQHCDSSVRHGTVHRSLEPPVVQLLLFRATKQVTLLSEPTTSIPSSKLTPWLFPT